MNNSVDLAVNNSEEIINTTTALEIITTTLRPDSVNAQTKLEMYLMTFAHYRLSVSINSYGYITEVVLGSVTNMLALTLMLGLLNLTICNYMAALAIADMSVVLGPGLIRWLSTRNYDPKTLSTGLCRFLNFQSYWSFSISAWLLVAMTVDRYIAITYPLKALVWSTPKRARMVIAALMLLMFLINMHFFFTMGVVEQKNIQQYMCIVYEPYTKFIDEIWPWIDATVYSFLPFAFLIVFNYLLIKSHRHSVLTMGGSVKSTNSGSTHKVNRKLTTTLLTVSFVFLVLTAPRIILLIIRNYTFNFKPTPTTIDFKILASYTLTSSIVNILMIANHCINFILYILTGKKFRQRLMAMVKCQTRSRLKHQQVSSVLSCSSEILSHRAASNSISSTTVI